MIFFFDLCILLALSENYFYLHFDNYFQNTTKCKIGLDKFNFTSNITFYKTDFLSFIIIYKVCIV